MSTNKYMVKTVKINKAIEYTPRFIICLWIQNFGLKYLDHWSLLIFC